MRFLKKYWSDIPLLTLVAANTVPLWGVLFLGWDAFYIVLLYWAENLAVGFYNILKIAFVKVPHPVEHLGKLFFIPFFIIHYGGFTAVHGLFILVLFKKSPEFLSGNTWPCFLVFVQLLLNVIKQAYSVMTVPVKYALAGLFFSHGVSFVDNFLLKREFASAKPDKLMGSPYARVVVMHIAIIVGAFLTFAIGSPVALLVVLIVLKTILDARLHLREHTKTQAATL
ncbi:MAG: DUF6498-containing protein [Planctomycetota bacterium]|nr:DUF6498-containing protein [Planctomycetota bacterium]